jgi:hypothetical protein
MPADSHLLHPFVSMPSYDFVRFFIRVEDCLASEKKSKFIQYVQVTIACFADAYEFCNVIYEHA